MAKKMVDVRPEFVEAEETFVVDVQFCIQALMNEKGWTQADLAGALGVTPARVSQMLGDDDNLTIRTVARIFAAMGEKCHLTNATIEARLTRQQKAYADEVGEATAESNKERGHHDEMLELAFAETSWVVAGNDNDPFDCWLRAA
jgi:transcriptional regulator with XRE-family HTH domain